MAHAVIDPDAAWTEAESLTGYDDGNTATNTLYWIATRP
jgi:endo-1,3(4)-beta-glucanase